LHGFTGLEIILAYYSRSAQGAGPFHYDLALLCQPFRNGAYRLTIYDHV